MDVGREIQGVYIHTTRYLCYCYDCVVITNYTHLEKARKSRGNSDGMPATNLTYEEVKSMDQISKSAKHFVGVKLWDEHPQGQNIKDHLKTNLSKRSESITWNALAHVSKCVHDITANQGYLINIKNESRVRFTYGDPLVSMLCSAFGYKVELEDTIDEYQKEMYNCEAYYTDLLGVTQSK